MPGVVNSEKLTSRFSHNHVTLLYFQKEAITAASTLSKIKLEEASYHQILDVMDLLGSSVVLCRPDRHCTSLS